MSAQGSRVTMATAMTARASVISAGVASHATVSVSLGYALFDEQNKIGNWSIAYYLQ